MNIVWAIRARLMQLSLDNGCPLDWTYWTVFGLSLSLRWATNPSCSGTSARIKNFMVCDATISFCSLSINISLFHLKSAQPAYKYSILAHRRHSCTHVLLSLLSAIPPSVLSSTNTAITAHIVGSSGAHMGDLSGHVCQPSSPGPCGIGMARLNSRKAA